MIDYSKSKINDYNFTKKVNKQFFVRNNEPVYIISTISMNNTTPESYIDTGDMKIILTKL